jgi:acetyltransferase
MIAAGPATDHEVLLRRHSYLVRTVLPSDEAALLDMFLRSSPEDLRLRCLGTVKDFPRIAAARLVQCDGVSEMALVAVDQEAAGRPIVGVVHIVREGEAAAEYDILVRTDKKGLGIGYQLMSDMLAFARISGFATIDGYISAENRAMLQMATELGFTLDRADAGVVRVKAALQRVSSE